MKLTWCDLSIKILVWGHEQTQNAVRNTLVGLISFEVANIIDEFNQKLTNGRTMPKIMNVRHGQTQEATRNELIMGWVGFEVDKAVNEL